LWWAASHGGAESHARGQPSAGIPHAGIAGVTAIRSRPQSAGAIDQDCGPSGVAGTKFKNLICGGDGFCADITGQYSSDDDCAATAANGQLVKKFCVATTSAPTVTYASAITATK
jgi:hypothetical protein